MARSALALRPSRQRTEILVQTWLKERRQLLAQLCALPDTHSGADDNPALREHIQSLCQTLMDYISAGHFEVYRELANEAHRHEQGNLTWLEDVLRQLEASTDAALAFNDLYDQNIRQHRCLSALPEQIANLLEQLEQRFGLEDQLIISFHLRNNQTAPPAAHHAQVVTH